jgi:predicted secreted protein
MNAVSGALVFVMVWWVALFAVLPWGARPPENPEPGMATGAPETPRIAQKMLATTLLALAIWLAIYVVIAHSGFSFREWAKSL